MYTVTGSFQNLTQKDIEILQQKGFSIENNSNMRTIASTNPVPVMINNNTQTINVLPSTWAEYVRDFNALFGKKFTVRITSNPGFNGGAIALGGYYENDNPVAATDTFGYIRDNFGNPVSASTCNAVVEEFSQTQFGQYIKFPSTDVPTISKFARFCSSNPVAVVGMRITSGLPTQLLQQPSYFEKITGGYVKESALSTVAKPAIIVEQFQSNIANIVLPDPFIVDGSSFITYGVLGGGQTTSVLEIAYAEAGSLSRGTIDNVKRLYDKYNKVACE